MLRKQPVASPQSPVQHEDEFTTAASVLSQGIPEYDAIQDTHCAYTKSKSFRNSPYYKLQLATQERHAGEVRLSQQSILAEDEFIARKRDTYSLKRPRPSALEGCTNMSPTKGSSFILSPQPSMHSLKGTAANSRELHLMKLAFLREGLVEELERKYNRVRKTCERGVALEYWTPAAVNAHVNAAALSTRPTVELLRKRSVQVVEAVQAWRSELGNRRTQFQWRDFNYLLKMSIDLNFLGQIMPGGRASFLSALGLATQRNPLLASVDLDTLADQQHACQSPACAQFPASLDAEYIQDEIDLNRRYENLTQNSTNHASPRSVIPPDDEPITRRRLELAAIVLLQEERQHGRLSGLFSESSFRNPGAAETLIPQFKSREPASAQDDISMDAHVSEHGVELVPESRQAGILAVPQKTIETWTLEACGYQTKPKINKPRPGIHPPLQVQGLTAQNLRELARQPSELAQGVLGAVRVLLLNPREPLPPRAEFKWDRLVTVLLENPTRFLRRLSQFKGARDIPVSRAKFLQPIFKDERFDPASLRPHSPIAAQLCVWCLANASKYVFSVELCFDHSSHLRLSEQHNDAIISTLKQEITDLKQHILGEKTTLAKTEVVVPSQIRLETSSHQVEVSLDSPEDIIISHKTKKKKAHTRVISTAYAHRLTDINIIDFASNKASESDKETAAKDIVDFAFAKENTNEELLWKGAFWSTSEGAVLGTVYRVREPDLHFRIRVYNIATNAQETVEMSEKFAKTLIALDSSSTGNSSAHILRGFTDGRAMSNMCKMMIELRKHHGIEILHPEYGLEISGARLHMQLKVKPNGDILLKAQELSGDEQPIGEMRPGVPLIRGCVPSAELEILGYPSLPELLERIEIHLNDKSERTLRVHPRLAYDQDLFIDGYHIEDFEVRMIENGTMLRVSVKLHHVGTLEKEATINSFRSELRQLGDENADDDFLQMLNSYPSRLAASAIVDRLLVLPWPEHPTGFRLEFASWQECGLRMQVRLNHNQVCQVLMGPRSTLFDARRQIERADVTKSQKFLFEQCPKKHDEVVTAAFAFFPTLNIFSVDFYSDDEYSDGDVDSFFDLASPEPEDAGKSKKRKKRRRRKRRARVDFLTLLMRRGLHKTPAEIEAEEAERRKAESRARKEAKREAKRKAREERRRRRVFFEELVKLPGSITVRRGASYLTPSVDLSDLLERGDLIEIEGVRAMVSKNKRTQFDPCTVPLAKPFDVQLPVTPENEPALGDIDSPIDESDSASAAESDVGEDAEIERAKGEENHELDGQEINGEDEAARDRVATATSKASSQGGALIEDSLDMGDQAKEYVDVEAYRVIRTPGKVIDIKHGLASVETGSRRLETHNDLRYDLRVGDFVRLNETVLLQLSEDPEDPFEPDHLTLKEPFPGTSLFRVLLQRVVVKELSEKEKEKSILQKQKEEQAEKLRKARLEEELRQTESFFGFTMSWRELVPMLGTGPLHPRQQDFWDQVTMQFAIRGIYKMICAQWFPASEGMDNVKFMKFLRELPGVINDRLTVTDIDLIFARSKGTGERRLTMREFIENALAEVATTHYPWLDDRPAVKKFLETFVENWKECKRIKWTEAKRLAVVVEAKRQCAAKFIQKFVRGSIARKNYKIQRMATIRLQAHFKSCHNRNQFLEKIARVRRTRQVKQDEARSLRESRSKSRIYAHARLITGVLNIVTIFKHMKGSILIQCYRPTDCEKNTFTLTLDEIRLTVEEATNISNYTDEELYQARSLEFVLERIQYRKRGAEPMMVLGRKPVKENGTRLLRQGVYVMASDNTKVLHIVTVTEARGEYSFHAYNPTNGVIKSVVLSRKNLHAWFHYDPEADSVIPPLLRPARVADLMQYLVKRLILCKACGLSTHLAMHRRGDDVLMLECDVQEQREYQMACRIQGLFRQRKAYNLIVVMIHRMYRKQWDPESHRWYYVRFDTGEVSWTKPRLLGSKDLPDPPDKWEACHGADGSVYYYHPLTGRTAWLSEDEAATRVQRLFRKKQGVEFRMDFPTIVQALSFQRQAELHYQQNPGRLSSIANYALLVHTREHDYVRAKRLYEEALEKAPHSPLLLYAFAILELAMNGYPRRDTFSRAMRRIDEARRTDPKNAKFVTAKQSFFFWSVVSQPQNPDAWLNWAIVKQSIDHDYERAEKFFRKALDLDPTHQSAMDNYKDFLLNRLPGGRFEGGGPGDIARKRSRVVSQDGEWMEMFDPEASQVEFSKFWFNSVTQQTQWKEPHWELEWIQRRKRAKIINEHDGWSQFDDSVTGACFYYRLDTGIATWDCPPYLKRLFLGGV